MKRVYKYIVFAAVLCLVSCDNKEEGFDGSAGGRPLGGMVNVGLSLKVAPEVRVESVDAPGTKAPHNVPEISYDNVWVLQFDGTGDDALLVAPPYYLDDAKIAASKLPSNDPGYEQIVLPLIESLGAEHRMVFIANTDDKFFSWGLQAGINTFRDLEEKMLYILEEGNSYKNHLDREVLIMSASAVTPIDPAVLIDGDSDYSTNTGPGVPFERNVAKIQLDLSIDAVKAAGYKVLGVQLLNVSAFYSYIDSQATFPAIYPPSSDIIDYEQDYDENGIITSGESKTYIWYVPRNTRGSVPQSHIRYNKNLEAPVGATYIEILAIDVQKNPVFFRIYPGMNDYDDFNIMPNYAYDYQLNICGDGGTPLLDSRIKQAGDITFDGHNNSFVLTIPYKGTAAQTYHIPVVRVNDYWEPTNRGYGGLGEQALKGDELTGDEWTIDVLWQDHNNMLRPVGTANPETNVTIVKNTGRGGEDYFSVRVPANAPRGNAVVCLRKGNPGTGDIWWSWHLWITDYDPNPESVTFQSNKWVFPVKGGQLERYGGALWGYPNSSTDDYTYAPTATSHYKESYSMDRYLGAVDRVLDVGVPNNGKGVEYQFGRKDPLPLNITLYDINGTALTSTPPVGFPEQKWVGSSANASFISGGTTMINAVHNPNVYYSTGTNNRWVATDVDGYTWGDSKIGSTLYTAKSIFDPCPQGWEVPYVGALSDFRGGITVHNAGRNLAYTNGVYYWPNIKVGDKYPGERKIFFTSQLPRNVNAVIGIGSYASGGMFYANTYGIDLTYVMNFSTVSIAGTTGSQYAAKSHTYPIRCVSMKH